MKSLRDTIKDFFYPDWPKMGTIKEWAEWDKKARQRKFAYWMSSTMPSWFAVKGMQIHDGIMWFKYRFKKQHKYHLIDTGLKPGYYEIETRMLHGMFNLLKQFVEREKAQLYYCSLDKNDVRPSPRFAGLAHLEWEIGLTHNKEECEAWGKPELAGKPTEQAKTAQIVKDLYLWWVDERPDRKDPWDSDYIKNKKTNKQATLYDMLLEDDEDAEERRAFWDSKQAIEDAYNKEDDEMLIKLINIRRSLWS